MLIHGIISLLYSFWIFLWEYIFPWNQRSHTSYIQISSQHIEQSPAFKVVKYLLNRLIKFDYVTLPNTYAESNTYAEIYMPSRGTDLYTLKLSKLSPCFSDKEKRILTWETRVGMQCGIHLSLQHHLKPHCPQPLHSRCISLLSVSCTQHISSQWNSFGISTALKVPLFSLVQCNSHWSFIYQNKKPFYMKILPELPK